jgi:hypothetical protein
MKKLIYLFGMIILFFAPQSMGAQTPCPTCKGSGKCINCGGKGYISIIPCGPFQKAIGCSYCGGGGSNCDAASWPGSGKCPTCHGTGHIAGSSDNSDKTKEDAEKQKALEEQRKKDEEELYKKYTEEQKRKQEEFDKSKEDALKSLKGVTEGESELKGIEDGKPALKGIENNTGKSELKGVTPSTNTNVVKKTTVQKEQDEFDKMNEAWLRKQQELVRQAVSQDQKWTREIKASIKNIPVPSPIFRPKSLNDLHPGDILLLAPDNSFISKTIVKADPLYRTLDFLSGGDVSVPDRITGRVSHAITFVGIVNGQMLFLDDTKEGAHILNRDAYMMLYGDRPIYIARPQAKVDGKEIYADARENARQKKSDYGVFGKDNYVCSEKAALVVGKATGIPATSEHHHLWFFMGAVDITPNDFFDDNHIGKYFAISADPIMPSKK